MRSSNWPRSLSKSKLMALSVLAAAFIPLAAGAQGEAQPVIPDVTEITIDLYHEPAEPQLTVEADLQSKKAAIRLNALRKLDDMGAAAAPFVPALIKVVDGIHDDERQQALSILRAIGTEAAPAVPILTQTLDDKQYLRDRAIEALEAIGPAAKDAVPALMQVLKAGNTTSHAELALASIGSDAVPALLAGLIDKSADCRRLSVCALGKIKQASQGTEDKVIVPAITKMLQDKDFEVAREACWALEKIGAPAKEAVPKLIETMSSKNGYIRQFSADALGSIGTSAKEALPVLNKALTDEQVRISARSAIKKIEQGDVD